MAEKRVLLRGAQQEESIILGSGRYLRVIDLDFERQRF